MATVSQSFGGVTPNAADAVNAAASICLDKLKDDFQYAQASVVAASVGAVAAAYDAAFPAGTEVNGDVTVSTGEVRPTYVQLRIGG